MIPGDQRYAECDTQRASQNQSAEFGFHQRQPLMHLAISLVACTNIPTSWYHVNELLKYNDTRRRRSKRQQGNMGLCKIFDRWI